MACRQIKRAGLAREPDFCVCLTKPSKKCLTHKGVLPDCEHVGCLDCRGTDFCCTEAARGVRGEDIPGHV